MYQIISPSGKFKIPRENFIGLALYQAFISRYNKPINNDKDGIAFLKTQGFEVTRV